MSSPVVVLERVSKTYLPTVSAARGAVRALDGVSVEVNEGEIVGVAGPEGAGKSTLLRVAAGMQRPDGGRVTWSGANDCPPRHAAFVPAHALLHEFLSVREALRFCAAQRELDGLNRIAPEELWVVRFGLAHRLEVRVGALEAVERRIVTIA
ncbi:MAG: ATP-binding cassette domain-containing protein, partial [Gemmatimonadaceae bacterium]|nr:ATP-binding cassette domain-containing protein [Gemmatimonadaceae bacterium]